MNKINDNIVDISYQQTGKSSNTNELGMREMQAKAYEVRNHRFLLIKAPPASGKSRALMFIALDKLKNQGIKKVVVAVPEKSIGRSFQNTDLMKYGFFADWRVAQQYNLCDNGIFNFYDGVIKGETGAIYGSVTEVEPGYKIVTI